MGKAKQGTKPPGEKKVVKTELQPRKAK
jgi:hypothetical protein